MKREPEYEADLRWFSKYPPRRCLQCGKPAVGDLMDNRNSNYGGHCQRCADKRLKAAKVYREYNAAIARAEGGAP